MSQDQETHNMLLQVSPLLYRAGLISLNDDDTVVTAIGRYPLGDDPEETIGLASLELEAELPKHYLLRFDGEDVTILRREVDDDGAETLTPEADVHLDAEDVSVLLSIIAAQGGLFKRYGVFRFDLNLHRQGLSNCPYCGEVWRSSRGSPLRCPRCRRELGVTPVINDDRIKPLKMTGMMKDGLEDGSDEESPELLRPASAIQAFRCDDESHSFDPGEELLLNLECLAEEYDAEHLNLIRSKEANREVIEYLNAAERCIAKVLEGSVQARIWTDSVRPIGNWPHTAWISFGLKGGDSDIGLSITLLLDTLRPIWAFCIIPNVKELKRRHGADWSLHFQPVKDAIHEKLAHLEDEGLSLNDLNGLWTKPNSPGDRMRSAALVHWMFRPTDIEPQELQKMMMKIMEAYRELV